VLLASVPELLDHFFVVAYNPMSRGNRDFRDTFKKRHIREIAAYYGVAKNEVVLYDDDTGNCENTGSEFTAYQVNQKKGFRLNNMLELTKENPPMCFGGRNQLIGGVNKMNKLNKLSLQSRRFDVIDEQLPLSLIAAPELASDYQLLQLPPTLIISGGNELFYDDIVNFVERIREVQCRNINNMSNLSPLSKSIGDINGNTSINCVGVSGHNIEFLIGQREVHCYPMLGLYPSRRTFNSVGLGWLHELMFQGRYNAINMYNNNNSIGDSSSGDKFNVNMNNNKLNDLDGASPQALTAIDSIALHCVSSAIRSCLYDASPMNSNNSKFGNSMKEPEMAPERDIDNFRQRFNGKQLNFNNIGDDILSPTYDKYNNDADYGSISNDNSNNDISNSNNDTMNSMISDNKNDDSNTDDITEDIINASVSIVEVEEEEDISISLEKISPNIEWILPEENTSDILSPLLNRTRDDTYEEEDTNTNTNDTGNYNEITGPTLSTSLTSMNSLSTSSTMPPLISFDGKGEISFESSSSDDDNDDDGRFENNM